MIKVVTSAERHTSDKEWIHSEFSFSFADYDDPSNAHFGCMLAHNDNTLRPQSGFKEHPHHDLEIVSYVVSGQLLHQDNMGNSEVLEPGTVQVISAGTGINHSETNPAEQESARFIQMWFLPMYPQLEPSWKARHFSRDERLNVLVPVATGSRETPGPLYLNQDASIYIPILETGQELVYETMDERRTHLFLISGNIQVECEDGTFQLEPGDAARIQKCCDLRIKGTCSEGESEFILVDIS